MIRNNYLQALIFTCLVAVLAGACSKSNKGDDNPGPGPGPAPDTSLTNGSHLNNLQVSVNFENGQKGTGVYIYADAPSYAPVAAPGEGFACVDDVARALLYYVRSSSFATDKAIQQKAFGMTRFVLNMQSANGYFYNFVQTGNLINKYGISSINQPKWWSWRALQAFTEATPIIKTKDAALARQMETATSKLMAAIKADLVNAPSTTALKDGIEIPQWLPEGPTRRLR
ncbi:hypothetical protein [Paraflavitalea speifideaquila]|uniref:hypothetical protein n=1 Tax=Paraflavitalea speifideaquila TaxID=3076558 RepID=UPI0028E40A11|nr:hypothetical protein [Paraflavitalea speifideiaquila]